MKNSSAFLLSLLISLSTSAQKKQADTNFIVREFDRGDYHAVFIQKIDTSSTFYKRIVDFSWDANDSLGYQESLKWVFKDKSLKMSHHVNVIVSGEWSQLYEYKGSYYLYAPSDWGNLGRVSINDSTFIQYSMDGPYASLITSCWGSNTPKTLDLTLAGPQAPDTVRIHNINWAAGLALFEYRSEGGRSRFELMVRDHRTQNYPIIVNYSPTRKWLEFPMDTLNVKKVFEMQR